KNLVFPVKNEKLFERSEFFSFREIRDFLASEREPAVFLFCYLFSFCCQKEKSNSKHKQKKNFIKERQSKQLKASPSEVPDKLKIP
ncbi:MAG: hypothetical protein IJX29_03655, partial [Bacteroides sp.]|nr:hypothetical protein [Bacteroides sp.]